MMESIVTVAMQTVNTNYKGFAGLIFLPKVKDERSQLKQKSASFGGSMTIHAFSISLYCVFSRILVTRRDVLYIPIPNTKHVRCL